MKQSDQLRQTKSAKIEKMRAIYSAAKDEGNRVLTDEERENVTRYKSEIDALNSDIENAMFLEAEELAAAEAEAKRSKSTDQRHKNKPKKTPEENLTDSFSMMRAISSAVNGKQLSGAEAEAMQEAKKEYRAFGKDIEGNVAVPSFILNGPDRRDQTVGTDSQGGYGVFTDFAGHIDPLRPRPIVEAAGATVLRGLTSNVRFTKNGIVTAAWEGENDANAEADSVYSVLDLSPKRVGAATDLSKQLTLQATPDVDRIAMTEIRRAIENQVDLKAINGSGSAPIPEGILNVTGIGDVAGGTNGAAAAWGHIVDLETEVSSANADFGTMAYITTPGVRGKLKQTEKASGTANYIWTDMTTNGSPNMAPVGMLNGYRAFVSTNVPSTLTKGTGTGLHAIIFGSFNALYLANWGGLDIIVDPYTGSKNALVSIVINSWWDVGVRWAAHFAAMQDASIA